MARRDARLGERAEPGVAQRVDEQRDLHAVARGEGQRLEQRAVRGELAGERLREPGQLRHVQVEQRASHELRHAAALVGRDMAADQQRPREGALDELELGHAEQRAEDAEEVRRVRVRGVRVEIDEHVAARRGQPAPHGVSLAERGSETGRQRMLRDDFGARGRGAARRAVGRVGVDDEHLVDQAGLGERHHGRVQHGADRRGAALGRQDHGDDARPLALQQRGGVVGRALEAAPRKPLADLEIAAEPAPGAALGPRRGAHAHAPRARDGDAGGRQALPEGLVLQGHPRLQPARPPVGAGGHPERRAGEVRMLGRGVGAAHGGEPSGGALVAPRERRRVERGRLGGIEFDQPADRLGTGGNQRELLGEPARRGARVGVRAGDEPVGPEPREGELHPVPPRGADAGPGARHHLHGRGDALPGRARDSARLVAAAVEHDDDGELVGLHVLLGAQGLETGRDPRGLVARGDDHHGPERAHGGGSPAAISSRPPS